MQPPLLSYGVTTADDVRIEGTAHQDSLTGEWVLCITIMGGEARSCGYHSETRLPAEDGALGAGLLLRYRVEDWAAMYNDMLGYDQSAAPDDDDDWSDDWGDNSGNVLMY